MIKGKLLLFYIFVCMFLDVDIKGLNMSYLPGV